MKPDRGDREQRVYKALVRLWSRTSETQHLTDIARRAELPLSTTRRHLMRLMDQDRVVQTDWGTYGIKAGDVSLDAAAWSIVDTTELLSDATRAELSALQRRTRCGVLAYVPLLGQRLCVWRQLGDHAETLRSANTDALWQAPLEADPAGWVLLPNRIGNPGASGALTTRPSRTAMPEATGASVIDGWDMTACAFGTSTGVAGAVCLLTPHDSPIAPQDLQDARLMTARISRVLSDECSPEATRQAS